MRPLSAEKAVALEYSALCNGAACLSAEERKRTDANPGKLRMRLRASGGASTANTPEPTLAVTAPLATSANAARVAELTGAVK
jgi:hypothetical protein